MSTLKEIEEPTFTHKLNGYSFWFNDVCVRINVERLSDDGIGELSFYSENGTGRRLLHISKVNLLSTPTLTQLTKRLSTNMDIDWATILTHVTSKSLEALRIGEPLENINTPPKTTKLEYLLYPILVKDEPTTIYAPGGHAKSVIADAIAVAVQCKIAILDWCPTPGNVLYLDWEASKERHQQYIHAIKKGLEITDTDKILYRFCERPLFYEADSILKVVNDHKIDLIITDSQMAAEGEGHPGSTAAQVSSMYYNTLRSFRCTSLTIDHTNRMGMDSQAETVAPYGSVVKYNRSRSQFEIKKSQEAGEDYIELALVHKKFNLGMIRKPYGIRIDFVNDTEGNLDKILFKQCDLADNPVLSSNMTTRDRIISELRRKGGQTIEELFATIGGKRDTIKKSLTRNEKNFIEEDEKWYIA